jgi:hypothetical protein
MPTQLYIGLLKDFRTDIIKADLGIKMKFVVTALVALVRRKVPMNMAHVPNPQKQTMYQKKMTSRK